ncbi:hypothetical protein J3F83DRAFT_769762 [Trichoderma novae-zelandiae]
MVGAAQYLDDEIDWVLSAVVGKKKQSYIQTHFQDKFGRHLNHNQIRYIKNKYGKDPRFNSPLVNARPPRVAVSPKPGAGDANKDEGEQESENETAVESASKAGPAADKVGERRSELKGEAAAARTTTMRATRMKRKRSTDVSSDIRERLVKKITGPQRSEFQPNKAAAPEPASATVEDKKKPLQVWKSTAHVQPSALATSLATSLADNYFDTLQTGEHAGLGAQQPNPMQFHGSSTDWMSSIPRSVWGTGESPTLTSAAPTAYMSIYHPASTMEELYHPVEQTATMSHTPGTAQYQLQMPSSHPMMLSASQFSPSMPDLAPSPFQHYREQQQVQHQHPHQTTQSEADYHYHLVAASTPAFPHIPNISEPEAPPTLDSLTSIPYQHMPSFHELLPSTQQFANLPILTASGDVTEHH